MSKLYIRGLLALLTASIILYFAFFPHSQSNLPIIAIANYGPHISLQNSIDGLKSELAREGFIENQSVQYDIADVNYQHALIPQMLTKLSARHPKVIVSIATPVTQLAKNQIKNIPLVFSDVTDPVAVGLLKDISKPDNNLTGASDQQNLTILLDFAKLLFPNAKTVGVLYATGEPNDLALIKMMGQAAQEKQLSVLPIAIHEARDVPQSMQAFKNKVDFIYVGVSGPIQPTLPMIAAEANKMNIPVLNADSNAVKDHQVLASFGVDYHQVGVNTGKIVVKLLKGEKLQNISPILPAKTDHHGFINKKMAEHFGIVIPPHLNQITVVE
jgi:putative ABC transport system substrate-binding protein